MSPRPIKGSILRALYRSPDMGMYEDVTICPECGEELDREHDREIGPPPYYENIEYVRCEGEEPHWWRITSVYRDRSVWFYRVIGPMDRSEASGAVRQLLTPSESNNAVGTTEG